MVVNDPFEVYTMLLGFFLNNRIWDLMVLTGLAYVPLLVLIVSSVSKAYQGGDDEGDRGSMALRYIEVGLIRIFVVMIFCLIPNGEPFETSAVRYNNYTCNAYDPLGTNEFIHFSPVKNLINAEKVDEMYSGLMVSVNGVRPTPPLWLQFTQNLSSKATNAVVSSMPCNEDIASIILRTGEIKQKEPDSDLYFDNFVKQCYLPSVKNIFLANNTLDVDDTEEYWVGADTFTNLVDGKYRFRSMTFDPEYWERIVRPFISATWPYNPNLDQDKFKKGFSTPSCQVGFQVLAKITEKDFESEIAELNSDLFDNAWDTLKNVNAKYFGGEKADENRGLNVILKRLTFIGDGHDKWDFMTTEEKVKDDYERMDYKILGDVVDVAKHVGLLGSYGYSLIDVIFAKMLAMPAIAMVQCLVFAVAPILILLSNYSLKTVGMLTVTIFGLEFTGVIFAICDWLDGISWSLMGSSYTLLNANNRTVYGIIHTAINYSYLMLPVMWYALLGTVGFMASGMGQAMANQARSASTAAQKGGSAAVSAGKSAAGATAKAAKASARAPKISGYLN